MNDILVSYEINASIAGAIQVRAIWDRVSNEMIDAMQFSMANGIAVEIQGHYVYIQEMEIKRDYGSDYFNSFSGGSYPKGAPRSMRVVGVAAF